MTLAEQWEAALAWYRGRSRLDRAIWGGVAALAGVALGYVVLVQPVLRYRAALLEELEEGEERLARYTRFLAAVGQVRGERDALIERLAKARERLIPGGTATLGAAHLQGMVQSLAKEKGITIQSTQVMREEVVKPFRRVSVRLTVSGELRPLAEFLAGIEYGPLQLRIPFIEVRRRGVTRRGKGPRALQATIEVSGFLKEAKPAAAGEEAGAEKTGERGGEAAPPGKGESPGALPKADASSPSGAH